MELSSELISQFVKINSGDKEVKSENTVYGTIREFNNSNYVQIDGSNQLTPISTTVYVEPGERVMVMIKNHTAVVTGNLSSPSARNEDLNKVEGEVSRKISEFEIIIADKVSSKELDAAIGRIDNLTADNVVIKETLEANEADIEELKTDKLGANEAEIIYAKITDLESQNGIIERLIAEVSDIDTLIFGSATGNVIQTSFSNAVIAQLGEAQIKSAMVESISAKKITSGDIITNNVRVLSEDGKLIISDETIQISDSNRIRVQIGKDSNDDYSINIWDSDGNLMFNEGGITDKAIKDAIIRDDMVSDTANIAAHKLNIDSLFEEINDSAKTIKSSKIYLDEEGQSLDVAFKELITSSAGLQNTVTSQGTQISVIQNQISSKIWQSDINDATSNMSTQYSLLEQRVDGVSLEVSNNTSNISEVANKTIVLEADLDGFKSMVNSTYATTEDVDELSSRTSTVEQTAEGISVRLEDLQIGGRNFIRYGKLDKPNDYYWASAGENISVSYDKGYAEITKEATNSRSFFIQYPDRNRLLDNVQMHKKYTLSVDLKGIEGYSVPSGTSVFIRIRYTDNTYNDYGIFEIPTSLSTTEWVRYEVTFCCDTEGKTWKDNIQVSVGLGNPAGGIAVRNFQIEDGDKATSFREAPEDFQNGIDESSKVATNYLDFSNSGLVVGDMTASSLGKNVRINYDSVDIRNGNTTLASFGANELILGQNASDSLINFCDGAAKLSAITSGATTSYPHYDGIQIESEDIKMKSSTFQVNSSNGTTFVNSGELRMVNQSSSDGSVSSFKSECKIASSGSRLSTGLLSSAYSNASSTYTDIYSSHYNASSGTTNSNHISVYPTHTQMSKPIVINNVYVTAINKNLWSGANYMNASQSITLSEAISAQVNGIVLVWSYYTNGAAANYNYHFQFIPKWFAINCAGCGVDLFLSNQTGNVMAHKYVYISDTKITGNDYNDDGTVTGSAVIYHNNYFVLRSVVGV